MSDEPQRPLSRRELRMREGWAAQDSLDAAETIAPSASLSVTDAFPEMSTGASEAHPPTTSSIPVIGPDGQLLTRRQLRELWAAEEAAAAAERDATVAEQGSAAPTNGEDPALEAERDTPTTDPADSGLESEESVSAAPQSVSDEERPGKAVDGAQDRLEEADSATARDGALESREDLIADDGIASELEATEETIAAQPSKRLRFPWSRSGSAESAREQVVEPEEPETAARSDEVSPPAPAREGMAPAGIAAVTTAGAVAGKVLEPQAADARESDSPPPETDAESGGEAEPVSVAETDGDVEAPAESDLGVETEAEDVEHEAVETSAQDLAPEPDDAPTVEPYSFPEVSPDPEARSIFDRPDFMQGQPAASGQQAAPTGAFDDIIERAVADEGAASPTTTAALILPAMPDTTDLSGALNETGEILITGSIELPKMLGETGGHESLHEALDAHEAAVLGHDVHELALEPHNDSQPVAASKAISAQSASTALVGAQPDRKGKLPLILAITAGSLTVIVAGVFIWAASTGLFG